MLTLIVFGVLAMMSSYADLKLAQKSGDWTRSYYSLDGKGDILVQRIDACLMNAETQADLYFTGKSYKEVLSDQIPMDLQKVIRAGWLQYQGNNKSEKEYLSEIYTKLYFYHAAERLEAAMPEYGFDIAYTFDVLGNEKLFNREFKVTANGVMKVHTLLTDDTGSSTQTLDIEIDILCPANDYSTIEMKNQTSRYNVLKWKQLQNQFKYDNPFELWDGEVNDR
jgi:hypothetical protein